MQAPDDTFGSPETPGSQGARRDDPTPWDATADVPAGSAGSSGLQPRLDMAPSTEREGDEVGPYRLLSKLGEGGFGVVWLAERRAPFVQRVALKVVKAGMDTASVLARFEQERQALAIMDHPGIAKVLDGGMTSSGRPYFAMEFVKGEPISDYCDRNRLTIQQRLELFMQVCDAVQHAHMKGLIHRDLKPSNVLVGANERGGPEAKVIDFGIAKALTQRLTERTIFTETGQMIGTPEYMSPEQAEPDATDIDTRTDVYSLGVMLYELLTGALPFEPRELRSKAYREIQRIIREVDPPAPSARMRTLGTRDAVRVRRIADARRERPEALSTRLQRELEWIPLKAMRKVRSERYGSPAALAGDIRNYLEGRALVAGPESAWYRLRKFLRRHRGPVAAVAGILLALVVGLVAAFWQWRVAEAALREARAMNAFVIDDVFGASDVDRYDDGVRAVDLVREALTRVDERFPDDAAQRARLRGAMGRALLGVGSPAEAVAPLEASVADAGALDARSRALVLLALAESLYRATAASDPVRSESLAREAMRLALGPEVSDKILVGDAWNHLGGALKGQGRLDEAEQAYAEALAFRRLAFGLERVETHVAEGNLALVRLARVMRGDAERRSATGRSEEEVRALAAQAEALYIASAREFGVLRDSAARDLGRTHAHAIAMASEHAAALLRASRAARAAGSDRADSLAEQAVAAFEPLRALVASRFARTHFRRVWICGNSAAALTDLGRRDEAAAVLAELFVDAASERSPITADQAALAGVLAEHLARLDRGPQGRSQLELVAAWARRGPDAAARLATLRDAAARIAAARRDSGDDGEARAWSDLAARLEP